MTFLGLDVGILVAVLASVGFPRSPAMSKVGFAVSGDGDVERIAVTGNLFYASLDRLAKHLHANPAARTLLDLTRVPYCDATAQAMIEAVQAERERTGGRLEVARAA